MDFKNIMQSYFNLRTLDDRRKKINEIIIEPHHYKPLKVPMQNTWRVQIGSFVLTFEINEEENLVAFLDYEHHDKVYGKMK